MIVGKPNPRIFKLALEDLNANSKQVAMVGDNPLTDILGALEIGIAGILVGKVPPPIFGNGYVPTPDATIPNLSFLFVL
jgi:FMN phosphatase YigB (HAD superfamily)